MFGGSPVFMYNDRKTGPSGDTFGIVPGKENSMSKKPENIRQEKAAQISEKTGKQLRGLYKNVHISVRSLNIIIIVLCAALIVCMAFGIANRGFTVSFNSMGGTAVESQKLMYGDLITEPDEPTREGYRFSGWYTDENLSIPWNLQEDKITESMTLYAGWDEA